MITYKIWAPALFLACLSAHAPQVEAQTPLPSAGPGANRSPATAQTARTMTVPTTPSSNGRARALLAQTYAAYRDLHSFACDVKYDITQIIWDGGKPERRLRRYSTRYAIQKPDHFVYTLTTAHGITETTVSDGKAVYMTTTDPKALPLHYVCVPSGAAPGAIDAVQAIYLSHLRPAERMVRFVPEAVFGVDFYPANSDLWQIEPPTTIDGEKMDTVGYSTKMSPAASSGSQSPITHRLTLSVSRRDHLLRQVRIEDIYPNGLASTSVETYSGVSANPILNDSVFAFVPAPYQVAVSDVAGLYTSVSPATSDSTTQQSSEKQDLQTIHMGARPGQDPAAFQATDLDGKPVKLSDYRGKVVLLDFWGTWCAPCLREMPSIVAAYKTYHPQGLEAIGFAIDRDASVVKRVAHDKQMTWRMVLNDAPHHDIANKGYVPDGVGVPYIVLIGRDGKVAASGRMSGEVLSDEIEAALRAGTGSATAHAPN